MRSRPWSSWVPKKKTTSFQILANTLFLGVEKLGLTTSHLGLWRRTNQGILTITRAICISDTIDLHSHLRQNTCSFLSNKEFLHQPLRHYNDYEVLRRNNVYETIQKSNISDEKGLVVMLKIMKPKCDKWS